MHGFPDTSVDWSGQALCLSRAGGVELVVHIKPRSSEAGSERSGSKLSRCTAFCDVVNDVIRGPNVDNAGQITDGWSI